MSKEIKIKDFSAGESVERHLRRFGHLPTTKLCDEKGSCQMNKREHKTDGTPCWCNPKVIKVKGMTKRQLNSLRQKIKEEDFIRSIQMAGLENMEEMWDWICVQIGLDENGKDIQEVIKAFIGLKLLEQSKNIIEKIDKVYIKERGIHNWLDLKDKLLKK